MASALPFSYPLTKTPHIEKFEGFGKCKYDKQIWPLLTTRW